MIGSRSANYKLKCVEGVYDKYDERNEALNNLMGRIIEIIKQAKDPAMLLIIYVFQRM